MRRFALIAFCAALPAQAAEWVPLTGAEIAGALTGHTVRYSEHTMQDFRRSGRTLYTHKGRESWGYWRVQGDQYCSQWPPNSLWACYDMARSGDTLRFLGTTEADVTDGTYVD